MNQTRNKAGGNIELQISIGEYKLVINVPKETRVAEVLNMVRSYDKIHQQYGPHNAYFLGLASADGNEVIDYWMTQLELTFSKFKSKVALKTIYAIQRRVDKISINQFQFLKCLGEGACGSVFLVRSRITGNLFALKRLKKQSLRSENQFKNIFREQKILRTLPSSCHTVKFHASFQSVDHFNFLLDFYPGGELFVHLKGGLPINDAKVYFCEILMAVEYLHRNNILYRDLKPQNILVDIHGHLCIADFGLSKCGFREDDITNSNCGSPDYMAPEVMESKSYNFSSDFYSIGAILYQFITGLPPYYEHGGHDEEIQVKLQKMKNMELNLEKSVQDKHLRQLIRGLLHPDPDQRICNFKEIKSSPWLADIDWKKIEQRSMPVPFSLSPYRTYINQQFLEKQDLVDQMNQVQSQKFQSFEFFDFLAHQSEKYVLGRPRTSVKQSNGKKKSSSFLKDKSSKNLNNKSSLQGNKGNISIALYEKQQLHRQSRGDTATTSNSNVSYEAKTSKHSQHKENACFRKQSGRKQIIKKVPSCNKIHTSTIIQTPLGSHNVSQFSQRKPGISKQKNCLTLKTRNNDLMKSKSNLTPAHKSRSKEKGQKLTGFKKQAAYCSARTKKQILPVSSYKIKLM